MCGAAGTIGCACTGFESRLSLSANAGQLPGHAPSALTHDPMLPCMLPCVHACTRAQAQARTHAHTRRHAHTHTKLTPPAHLSLTVSWVPTTCASWCRATRRCTRATGWSCPRTPGSSCAWASTPSSGGALLTGTPLGGVPAGFAGAAGGAGSKPAHRHPAAFLTGPHALLGCCRCALC